MNATLTKQQILKRAHTPHQIVDNQPAGNYKDHFQPQYLDPDMLHAAVAILQHTSGITTPKQIIKLRIQLSNIVSGKSKNVLLIEGNCAEPVDAAVSVASLTRDATARLTAIAASKIGGHCVHIQRRVQSVKPRSSEAEDLGTHSVPSYMGDAINGQHVSNRTPDPSRLIAMTMQANALEARLTKMVGRHIPAAHEALSLVYEQAMMATDHATDKTYLLSADLPWIGARTNQVHGAHVKLLQNIQNPIGIKVGDSSTTEHIQKLVATLNPQQEAGKLIFMLRLSPGNSSGLTVVLDAIKQYAANAVILYDVHGVTRTVNGRKVRVLPEMIEQIQQLSSACNVLGLRLHGLHLETMGDNGHTECIDKSDDLPTRPGSVDPQLNPHQLTQVLNAVASCLGIQS
jgi:3-deoxy-7-phosphoheptulonate synthase